MRKSLIKIPIVTFFATIIFTTNIFASSIIIKTEPKWDMTSTEITRGKIGVLENNNLYYVNQNGRVISKIGNLEILVNNKSSEDIIRIGDFERNVAGLTYKDNFTWCYSLAGRKTNDLNLAIQNYDRGFVAAPMFSEGLLGGKSIEGDYPFFDENGELLEFVDPNFNAIFKTARNNNKNPQYTLLEVDNSFSSGLVWFKAEDKEGAIVYGYINKAGKIIIEPRFEKAGRFSDNLAPVIIDGYVNYINKKGEVVLTTNFNKFNENGKVFANGLDTVAIDNGLWGVINRYGVPITGFISNDPIVYYGEYAIVNVNGKYGYVDRRGDIAIAPTYDKAYNFTNDGSYGALVCEDGKWFIINTEGKQISSETWDFEDAFSFSSLPEAVMYKSDGLWGLGRIEHK